MKGLAVIDADFAVAIPAYDEDVAADATSGKGFAETGNGIDDDFVPGSGHWICRKGNARRVRVDQGLDQHGHCRPPSVSLACAAVLFNGRLVQRPETGLHRSQHLAFAGDRQHGGENASP